MIYFVGDDFSWRRFCRRNSVAPSGDGEVRRITSPDAAGDILFGPRDSLIVAGGAQDSRTAEILQAKRRRAAQVRPR